MGLPGASAHPWRREAALSGRDGSPLDLASRQLPPRPWQSCFLHTEGPQGGEGGDRAWAAALRGVDPLTPSPVVGHYVVERGMIKVSTTLLGSKETQLGSSPPEALARMMLRELVADSKRNR